MKTACLATMVLWGSLFLCSSLVAQKYNGPRPPKPDVPYLLHADNLVETEVAEAKEQARKDEIAYIVAGAASPVKTPLPSPIFLLQADKLVPDKLELYRLDSKNGQREIVFSKKKRGGPKQYRLAITRLGENLYRLEAVDSLENGEYSLTPNGSNQVFCFQEY